MQLYNLPVLYTIFDGYLLYPSLINVGLGNLIENKINNNLSSQGLVLPFTRSPITDNITVEYLSSNKYSLNNNKLFVLLRNDGMFEEFIRYDEPPRIDNGKISEKIERFIFNDEGLQQLLSNILIRVSTVDEFANILELRLGVSTKLWEIYKIEDLKNLVLGNLAISKLKCRKVKSNYKTIYLE